MKYLKHVVKWFTAVAAVLAAITSIIVIYQFFSGHQSFSSASPAANVSSAPAPTVIITPNTNISSDSMSPTDTVSADSIDYTLSTWGCWIGIGLLVGSLAGGVAGYNAGGRQFGGYTAGCALGLGGGILVAIVAGWLSSVVINSLSVSHAFLWNIAITSFVVLCISRLIGHAIGKETR